MKTQKIETWLPVFSGFYGTRWEFDESNFLDEHNLTYDDIEVDYLSYRNDVVEKVAQDIESVLVRLGIVKSIEVERIVSPKEYNFHNDSVDIVADVYTDNIRKYIYPNREEFGHYLNERYTSRDGFISSYSNSFDEWEFETNGFKTLDIDGHRLGAILQFICELEDITEDSIEIDMDMDSYITTMHTSIDNLNDYDKDVVGMAILDTLDFEYGYLRILKQECEDLAKLNGIQTWQEVMIERYNNIVLSSSNIEKVKSDNLELIIK